MHHQQNHHHRNTTLTSSSSSSPSSSTPFADPFADDPFADRDAATDATTNGTTHTGNSSNDSNKDDILGPNGINADEGVESKDSEKLKSAWRFWMEKPLKKPGQTFEAENVSSDVLEDKHRLRTLFEFQTVQGFWRSYNSSINNIGALDAKESFHLMRKINDTQIKPLWEDPENANGGEWILRVDKQKAGEVWSDLLLAVIGEQLSERRDEICGISVSPRAIDFVFQVWVKGDRDDALVDRIKEIVDGPNSGSGGASRSVINSNFFRAHKRR